MLEIPLSFLVGVGVGYLAHREQTRQTRPMRLTTFSHTTPFIAPTPEDVLDQWKLYLTAFAFHGNMLDFSERKMTKARIVTGPGWEKYTEIMRDAGLLVKRHGARTAWAMGWNYPRLRSELKHNVLSLPFPVGLPPALNTRWQAPQMTHRRQTPQTPQIVLPRWPEDFYSLVGGNEQ